MRCNERIRISPIRLIDENDQQIGIVEIADALARAAAAGLDLVEVAPLSKPPVCRIMDYGKWKYAQRKKERKSKTHRHETALKEIRIKTPKIGEHDLQIKINHAREFLGRGDRVQFALRFRGRELAHIDEGQKVFAQIKQALTDVSKVEHDFRREGRRILMLLAPGGTKKPAAKAAAKPKLAAPAPAPQPPAATEPSPAPAEPPPSS
ncbi:MAG: translation initiation factor IF-3 [Phycisphaerae bacterium]